MKNKILLLSSLFILSALVIAAPITKIDTMTTNSPTKAKIDSQKGIKFLGTDSVKLPVGTTAQRDTSPVDGMFRLNSTTSSYEGYVSGAWNTLLKYTTSLLIPVETNLSSNKIINLADPTNAQDAATKNYIDTALAGVDFSNLVDRTTNQSVGGNKTFTGTNTFTNPIAGSVTGNAATVTTNANLTGHIVSTGNATTLGAFSSANLLGALTDETGTGSAVFSNSPTLVTPALGTPSALVGTNITGTASGLTAGSVTTNANLTGPITSVGNATAIASQTGTGSKIVVDTSPVLVTPNIGAASAASLAIGGAINANAVLDVQSTTKAFMAPRMTTAQKNAIASPTAGMEVFDTDLGAKSFYNGTQWISNLSISGDTVYSARATTSVGAPTEQNKSWIASCTAANPTVCSFVSNTFSVLPNCTVTAESSSTIIANIVSGSLSATSVSVVTLNSSTGALVGSVSFRMICQKQGADYANSSSSGILSSNADTNWANCPSADGGWTTNTSYACKYKYRGDAAIIQLKISTSGTPGGNTALSFNMPAAIGTIDTAKLVGGTLITNSGNTLDAGSAIYDARAIATSPTIVSFNANASGITKTYPMTWASGDNIEISFEAPIVGRTQSPINIIPFAGTATTPGYTGQVDDLVFSFGGTSLANNCTASPCFLSQDGNGISTVTRAGTGDYLANFPKLYKSVRCGSSMYITGTGPGSISGLGQCTNCSSLSFGTRLTTSGVLTDGSGTLICKGYY